MCAGAEKPLDVLCMEFSVEFTASRRLEEETTVHAPSTWREHRRCRVTSAATDIAGRLARAL